MTSLPGAGLAVSFPPSIVRRLAGVDHRHHGHGHGRAARANRWDRGDRGTMTSLPALALPSASRRRSSADWPASIIGTTGTAAHHVGTAGTATR